MNPYFHRQLLQTQSGAADLLLLRKVRRAVSLIPDAPLPDRELTCHILARAVAKVFSLDVRDGWVNPNFEHSWCVTAAGNILDVYPVGAAGGPILLADIHTRFHSLNGPSIGVYLLPGRDRPFPKGPVTGIGRDVARVAKMLKEAVETDRPVPDKPRTPTPLTDDLVAEFQSLRSSTLSYPCEQALLNHSRTLETAIRDALRLNAMGMTSRSRRTLLAALGDTPGAPTPPRRIPSVQLDQMRLNALAPNVLRAFNGTRNPFGTGDQIFDLEYARDGSVYTVIGVRLASNKPAKRRRVDQDAICRDDFDSLNRFLRKVRQPDPEPVRNLFRKA